MRRLRVKPAMTERPVMTESDEEIADRARNDRGDAMTEVRNDREPMVATIQSVKA